MSPTAVAPTLPPIAPFDAWPALRELSPETSQQVFRRLMEAFSRPGTQVRLPDHAVPAPAPAALTPLLALADLMSPLAALETAAVPAAAAVAALSRLTGAPVVAPAKARLALALAEPDDLTDLNAGSHWSPEHGAMLVQRVAEVTVADSPATGTWRLTGPGIPPRTPVCARVSGLSAGWVHQRAVLTGDYPAGIDCLLVTDQGDLLALPRTTIIEVI